ncbi:MAG: YegS/Rv2252/BmrU family lipid kinase [Acidimicrobiia bacterium]
MTPLPTAWTALLNPAAGRGRARALLPRVAEALGNARDARGLDVDVVVSASPADMLERAAAAFAAGRGVVACGGDGTVGALAGIAAEAAGTLAVVPVGSGNDFARHLGIPRDDVDAAVALLLAGEVTAVDLGRATAADGTTAWFTTVANTGFDAEANRWANTVDTVSGTPLYVAATLRTLARYRPQRFRITVDGEVHELDAWLVAIGNTRTYASGMAITPGASVRDGALDVCVVGPVPRREFLTTFPKVFSGTHVDHPQVHTWRAHTEVRVDGTGDDELWASGEHLGPLPATLVPAPGALRVVVPRDATFA